MLKQFLKHNRLFRTVFARPLAARSRWITRRSRACAALYRQAVVGGEIVVSPSNIPGRFVVPARSDLAVRIITQGRYEPEITRHLTRLASLAGDIINIGANVGLHAIFLARHCSNAKRIYAIEPNPEVYECLTRQRSLSMGSKDGSQRYSPASERCQARRSWPSFRACRSTLVDWRHLYIRPVKGHLQKKIRVPVKSAPMAIDDPGLEPSLLLVDTEGAELLVFQGASGLLSSSPPSAGVRMRGLLLA